MGLERSVVGRLLGASLAGSVYVWLVSLVQHCAGVVSASLSILLRGYYSLVCRWWVGGYWVDIFVGWLVGWRAGELGCCRLRGVIV